MGEIGKCTSDESEYFKAEEDRYEYERDMAQYEGELQEFISDNKKDLYKEYCTEINIQGFRDYAEECFKRYLQDSRENGCD